MMSALLLDRAVEQVGDFDNLFVLSSMVIKSNVIPSFHSLLGIRYSESLQSVTRIL